MQVRRASQFCTRACGGDGGGGWWLGGMVQWCWGVFFLVCPSLAFLVVGREGRGK